MIWNAVVMIVSLVYRTVRGLLSLPELLLRREASVEAEVLVLRHENAVLRRQLASPVRYEPADRLWFSALSSLIPRHRWARVFSSLRLTIWRVTRSFSARQRSLRGTSAHGAVLAAPLRHCAGSCPGPGRGR
jgi:putative transposase